MSACEKQNLAEVNNMTVNCEIESLIKSFKEEFSNLLGGIYDFFFPEYMSEDARRARYRWQFYYWK